MKEVIKKVITRLEKDNEGNDVRYSLVKNMEEGDYLIRIGEKQMILTEKEYETLKLLMDDMY